MSRVHVDEGLIAELSVRSIAHNIALKYPAPASTDAAQIHGYARRLADLCGGDTESFAEAGVALWRAIYVNGGPA